MKSEGNFFRTNRHSLAGLKSMFKKPAVNVSVFYTNFSYF